METFLNSFVAIDKDGTGRITDTELENYVKEHDLDPMMITRWKQLFDEQNLGYITVENFCDKLGLRPEQVKAKRAEQVEAKRLPGNVHVIFAELSLDHQVKICEETIRVFDRSGADEDKTNLTKALKAFADKEFGPHWQVAIVDGSYWITFSHVPECSFHFAYGGYAFLFWKLPV